MTLIHSWLNPKLELKRWRAGRITNGIFTKEPIIKDERLAIFGGHIMRVNEEPVFSDDKKDYALAIDEGFVIGTRCEDEIEDADYFNHSCNPNAGFKGQIFLVAMRDINTGEEITFDYAMVMCSSEEILENYEFQCLCGNLNCRGKITSRDWEIPELQKRYDGYFSWYLQEKINRVNGRNGNK